MPTVLNITFNNPSQVFFAGQTITGNLCITCTSQKYCREITVAFKGFSKVHWTVKSTEKRGGKTRTKINHYRSSETYYSASYRVWGNGTESVLPPGTHNFSFSYRLPYNIPSSFESDIGQVRHICTAKMDISLGTDKQFVQPYSVNCLYDLNTDSTAKKPIECNQHKNLWCFCCKSGPISMVLRVPRSGYVPGEKILVNAECSNKSRSRVDYSEANIHQVITYYTDGAKKVVDRKVAEMKRETINPGDDDIWSDVEFLVPALPPTRLQFCYNIDIAYRFKFKMNLSGCHTNLDHKVPLVIGSIPLRESFGYFAQPATFPNQLPPSQPHASLPEPMPTHPGPMPIPPSGGQPSTLGWAVDANPQPYNPNYPPARHAIPPPVFPGIQHYPDMPQPSYNECMFGASKVDDEDEDGGGAFAPRYASYNLSLAPPPMAAPM